MTKFGQDLVQSAKEALAIARGERDAARMVIPAEVDVRAIRHKLKLTQAEFSRRFGIPVATLRDWEQGRRIPESTAQILLKVIEREPEAVERALESA